MTEEFELAAGSVVGREHASAGRNNQDGFCWFRSPEATVAVVCDGCGSGRHSEVGARLGARLVVEALRRQAPRLGRWPAEALLESARLDVLAGLGDLAEVMGGDLARTVTDYLLFTVVGAVVAEPTSLVFTLGDGVAAVNGRAEVLSFPGNEPPYLAYALTGSSVTEADPAALRFVVRRSLATRELSSLLLGTDGVADLIAAAEKALPGRTESVGPLRQFWEDERYFRNPAALARRLTLLNRESAGIDWDARSVVRERGLLPDDTTLVVLRRRRFREPAPPASEAP